MSEPKTILVVDDTAPLRHILGIYFTQAGYKTIEASDGEMAIQKVNENEIDLIFLDVMMPKMDGYTVCRKLKETENIKNIPVIICTAKGGQEDVALAVKAGANDYILKPFSRETIMKKVEKFLGQSPAAVKAATEAKAAHEQAEAKKKSTDSLQKPPSTQPSEPPKPPEPPPPKDSSKPPQAPKS